MLNHCKASKRRPRLWKGIAAVAASALVLTIACPVRAEEKASEVKPGEQGVKEQVLPAPQAGTVTLEELLTVARSSNPALMAARRRHSAAQAVPSQARSLPDPMVMGGIRNVGLDRVTIGKEMMSVAGVSIQQMVPYPKKLSLKGEVAEREADRVGSLADEFERRLVRQVTVAYHDLFFIYKSMEIVENNKDILERFQKTAESRYSVGKGIQQDVFRAQVAVSRLLDKLSVLRQMEKTALSRLNTLLNRPPDDALGRPAEVAAGELAFTQTEMGSKAVEASPEVAAARWALARSRANLNLAKAQYYPDLTFRAAWMSREKLDDIWEGWVGFTVPLYSASKQNYGVKEARSSLEAAEMQLASARDEVLFTVADQYAKAHTSKEVSTLFKTGIIPQAQLSLESSVAGYEVGAVDFLSLLDNVKSLLNDELEYYREVTNFNKAVAVLEEVVGEPVTKRP